MTQENTHTVDYVMDNKYSRQSFVNIATDSKDILNSTYIMNYGDDLGIGYNPMEGNTYIVIDESINIDGETFDIVLYQSDFNENTYMMATSTENGEEYEIKIEDNPSKETALEDLVKEIKEQMNKEN